MNSHQNIYCVELLLGVECLLMARKTGFNSRLSHTKDSIMVLDASLLNTQHYKVWIKDKCCNPGKGVAPSQQLCVVAIEKVAFRFPSIMVSQLTWILPVLPIPRTISSESPAYITECWLLQISLHNWTNVMKKCVNIHCEEKTWLSWPIWQNCCQKTTVEEAKQYQKAPVGQGMQRLDNRAMEHCPFDWRIKVQNLWVK